MTILIAALGGEGGGVLTDWIVAAAASQGFPVQSTSIPGVAQRTGATTYHIEMVPAPRSAADPRPILALAPGVGDVDLVVASELMEAGRAIAGGFVTPERTTTIASTSRSYLVVEKMAMGDGRYDPDRLIAAVEKNSQEVAAARPRSDRRESGAMINAVMLGAIAGAGALPIPAEALESGNPRRRQSGCRQSARLPRRLRRRARRIAAAAGSAEIQARDSLHVPLRSPILNEQSRACPTRRACS